MCAMRNRCLTMYPSSRPRTFWASFHFTVTVVFITVAETPVGASEGPERDGEGQVRKIKVSNCDTPFSMCAQI